MLYEPSDWSVAVANPMTSRPQSARFAPFRTSISGAAATSPLKNFTFSTDARSQYAPEIPLALGAFVVFPIVASIGTSGPSKYAESLSLTK